MSHPSGCNLAGLRQGSGRQGLRDKAVGDKPKTSLWETRPPGDKPLGDRASGKPPGDKASGRHGL